MTMLRTKSEIDKHVLGLLYRAKTDHERNLRCFHIAKMYHKIKDYESAKRYANMYLSVRDDSAAAHKLLGQALEGLGQKAEAIAAYTKSLKLESDQSDLICKVCELLCDKDVEFDPALARYWSERASLLFPHSHPVFMLKEKLMSADSSSSSKDLEELLHAELKAKPTDVNVRIKLLKMYSESGRTEMALNHAFEVESRQTYQNCFAWYQCINNICKPYSRENFAKCGWEFYIQWLSALDRMCQLSLNQTLPYSSVTAEAVTCIHSFDEAICSASQCPKRNDLLGEFLKHMTAQLAYFMGLLLLKKAKKDNAHWKETKSLVAPLFVFAVNCPFKLDQNLTSNLKDGYQKLFQSCSHQVHCRQIQTGHLLMCLASENHSEKLFLDKVGHFIAGDWRRQVFEKCFSTILERRSSTSYFMTGPDFSKVTLKLPPINAFKPSLFVNSFENNYFGSLHHLVWLGLRSLKETSLLKMKLTTFQTSSFKKLQLTINNLNNIGVETINQLDVDSFLYATVFCTAAILEENKNNGIPQEEKPQVLPADISSPLCTSEQGKWWSNLCTLVKCGTFSPVTSNESMSDLRFSLQRGLEVVRGEGLSPYLIVALARTFAARAAMSNIIDESEGCHARAFHLWQVAYPTLERLVHNKTIISTSKTHSLFEIPEKKYTSQDIRVLFDEAKVYIGCHYLNAKQFEKAIDELKGVKTLIAYFNLGLVYQKWAEQLLDGVRGEEVTSDIRCRHVVLATKARDYFMLAKSLAKNDPKNPLLSDIETQLYEIEDMLARIEPENGGFTNGASDGTQSYGSNESPIADGLNLLSSTNQRSVHHHTSTPHRIHEQKANRFNMSELIDLLSVQQSTNQLKMQQVVEQIRVVVDKIDSIASEQRTQRCIIEGLTSRLHTFETEMRGSISDIKKDIKKPDFSNMFDEEDYTDEMLYTPYSQYYNQPQRVVPTASAAPGTVPYVNQYFSPRIDPLCQSFCKQQGALPFSEGQQLPDFLRQPKVNQPLLHSLQPGIPSSLNLSAGVAGPSRLPATSALPSNAILNTAASLTSSPPQPQLSINIPNSLRSNTTTQSDAPHNFQIPLPPQSKPVFNIEEREVEEETPPPTYDPLPDYKPIVPLPEEVEVQTGEEEEDVLFEKRAKLFRYVDKAWKDRGVGNLKILKNKSTGKVRILMRRDQVHKICANHFLTTDMELQPKVNTPNTWMWFANDFADEVIQPERFCVKFKTEEESEEFKNVFDKAREDLKAVKDITPSDKPSDTGDSRPPHSSLLAPVSAFSSVSSGSSPCVSTAVSTYSSPQVSSSSLFTSNSVSNTFFNQSASSSLAKTAPGSNEKKQLETSTQGQPTNIGGFTFSLSAPKFKVPEPEKPETTEAPKVPNLFVKFNFGISNDTPPKDSFSFLGSQNKSEIPNPFAISSKVSPSNRPSTLDSTKPSVVESLESRSPTNKDEGEVDNFIPTATFAPVIPMPDLVTVKTGEENEEVIFEARGHLYRFCKSTKQWKERGTGQMKILKHKELGSYRLLMRREQVLKVCCNHRITNDIILKPASSSDRALSWAAKDHSEDEPTDELFSLKFLTSDQAQQFKEEFEKVQQLIKNQDSKDSNTSTSQTKSKDGLPPLSELLKPKPGSWSCEDCYTQSNADVESCPACGRTKPGLAPKVPLSQLLKPKPGSWSCEGCYTRSDADVESCPACGQAKPGSNPKTNAKTATPFTFGIPQNSENLSSQNTFSVPFAPAQSSSTFTFGTPPFTTSVLQRPISDLFQSKDSADTTGGKFSFNSGGFTFGSPSLKLSDSVNAASSSSTIKSEPIFASTFPKFEGSDSGTSFGSAKFKFTMPDPSIASSPGNTSQHDESYDPEEEVEDHVQFQPVVPLPEKVDVVTGEENENVLYSQRAKLYRLESASKEWKERGVGDVKILQHKETGKIRFLMRREPVMKVCLNHFITAETNLQPKDEKSWLWYAIDFSEAASTNEVFVIRFKTPDIAQTFKDEFERAKVIGQRSSSSCLKNEDEPPKDSKDDESTGSDNDVLLVSEQKAPPDLVAKAISLKLPPNYYCYLENPGCPGCPGCEDDDNDNEKEVEKSTETKKTTVIEQNENFSTTISKSILKKEDPSDNWKSSPIQPTMTSIFGSSVTTPKSASFSFAQAFTDTNNDEKKTTPVPAQGDQKLTGFLFQEQSLFSSFTPGNNIFSSSPSGFSNSATNIGEGKEFPSFGTLAASAPSSDQQTPAFIFNASNLPVFSSLSGENVIAKAASNFMWEGAGQQVFGSAANKSFGKDASVKEANDYDEEGESDGDGEDGSVNKDDNCDPYFEPKIPLPAEIKVTTGEEDEDVLFCERAILYRHSSETKEWKERGVGEMKILKHKTKENTYRLLMRRETVHKLVCNHLLTNNFLLKANSERSFCWHAMNYIEDDIKNELLSVKFKNPEIAARFKSIVDDCIGNARG